MVALVCWKMYITNRVGPGSPGQRSLTRSKRQRYWHLEVPYPSDPNSEPSYGEKKYTHEYDNEQREDISGSTSTLDPNFNHTSMPAPVLERKTTGKLAGLGLGIHMQKDSPVLEIPGGPVQSGDDKKVHEGVNVEKTSTPPQAHVHNSRWDT
ncbi:hypothetical protein BDZ97DRAFT_1926028 [Flammula alnicola]|nr:hypothetical protein BDZ97DRAFT_1926028 [Flammula alnicola]